MNNAAAIVDGIAHLKSHALAIASTDSSPTPAAAAAGVGVSAGSSPHSA